MKPCGCNSCHHPPKKRKKVVAPKKPKFDPVHEEVKAILKKTIKKK